MRYLGPKCRVCRREGEKLFLKGEKCFTQKCTFNTRPFAPGQHGKSKKKFSEYGRQLREKQKVRSIYNLSERQFYNLYSSAAKKEGSTGEWFLRFLEMRLDNIVYRSQIVTSRDHARQAIVHGHFTVNGKRMDIPSYLVKKGDVIGLSLSGTKHGAISFNGQDKNTPRWLSVDYNAKKIEVADDLTAGDIDESINIQLIVEYYSR